MPIVYDVLRTKNMAIEAMAQHERKGHERGDANSALLLFAIFSMGSLEFTEIFFLSLTLYALCHMV